MTRFGPGTAYLTPQDVPHGENEMNATTAQQITAMLARKTEIDGMPSFEKRNIAWLFDAVELLLRIELERQESTKL